MSKYLEGILSYLLWVYILSSNLLVESRQYCTKNIFTVFDMGFKNV
jgi:hypothetical protein